VSQNWKACVKRPAASVSLVVNLRKPICIIAPPLPPPRYDEALKLYSDALEKNPNVAVLWKRKVAVHKARGNMEEAVKELCQFLEV